MARIAVGGFQHETNTFAPLVADYAAFAQADSWPALSSGEAMVVAVRDVHLPIAGAIAALEREGHEVAPLLWCSATPSDCVTEEAFERISAQMLSLLEQQLPLDGLYLDLHGAMVCAHLEDGEGELLRRIRALVGPDLPIAVSLDLHANITRAMFEQANVIDCYREYPHTDMGETGARTLRSLLCLLAEEKGQYAHKVMRKLDFQIPVTCGCTLVDPAKAVYQKMQSLLKVTPEVSSMSFACGFPLVDIFETGPAVLAYGESAQAVEQVADELEHFVLSRETAFSGDLLDPATAIEKAANVPGKGPVVLADTQDNPGGGGASDTMGVFRALVSAGVESAVVANITDAEVAAQAHKIGAGHRIHIQLGEGSQSTGESPFEGEFHILKTTDGFCEGTGPMYLGAKIALGPTALLQHQGVRVIVSSNCLQVADQAILQHVGIEPTEEKLIVLKSSVHFRNHFQDIARAVYVVVAPGPVTADLNALSYRKVRSALRVMPNGMFRNG